MKTRRLIHGVTSLLVLAALLSTSPASITALPLTGTLTWTRVTIPGLIPGTSASFLWTDRPGSVYVWTEGILPGTNTVPEAILHHWDRGTWHEELRLGGYSGSALFGTGAEDIYASAGGCPRTTQVECGADYQTIMYHFDGSAWAVQALPAAAAAGSIYQISGYPNNVQASVTGGRIVAYDGNSWSQIYQTGAGEVAPQPLTLIAPTEGYYTGCIGYGWWNGIAWHQTTGFSFCDVYDIWGTIDGTGQVHLYTVGNNGYSNGVRVWRGIKQPGTPPLVFTQVFADGNGYEAGSAYGVWGSGASDIYVVGRRTQWSTPGNGRIYHFDGSTWQQLTEVGSIPVVRDVWGSGPQDVWFSLADGTLLHYGLIYDFSGFFAPVNNPPVLNVAQAGRAIPIKFSLNGNQGTNILAPGYPVSEPIACDGSTATASIPAVTAGNSSLVYDPLQDQYIYVWKTDRTWADTCRKFILRLDDGTEHTTVFKFK